MTPFMKNFAWFFSITLFCFFNLADLASALDKMIDIQVSYQSSSGLAALQELKASLNPKVVRLMNSNDDAESQDEAEYRAWADQMKINLATVVSNLESLGIKAVIEIQDTPGGNNKNNSPVTNNIFEPDYEWARSLFKQIWIELAQTYNSNSTIVGYQIMNEPRTQDKSSWNNYANEVAKAIRSADSTPEVDQPYIIMTARYGNANFISELANAIPEDLARYILSGSLYSPHSFTHQGINDKLKLKYPNCKKTTKKGVKLNKNCTRKALTKVVKKFADKAKKVGLEAMITEYSVAAYAKGGAKYLKDLTSIFDKFGLHSNYHAWREAKVWDLELAGPNIDKLKTSSKETARFKVIRKYFAK